MQDEILKELQTWLCGFENLQKEKEQEQIKLWNYILKRNKEKWIM